MKITKRQLKKLILNSLNEGIFGDISDKLNYGAKTKELLRNSSQDAFDIFKACKGLGTDEKTIQEIIERRKTDLHKLYIEFNNLIANYTKANAGFKSVDSALVDKNYNQDLIAWLEEEGMDNEAALVEEAIAAAKVQRKEIPTAVKGVFF